MTAAITGVDVVVLVAIASVHVYWAAGGTRGKDSAIPSRQGRPVLTPTTAGTALVGLALFAVALLVAAGGAILPMPIPTPWLRVACISVAAVFGLRAIGDARYVGLFKRVKDSRFATLDTWVYAPLCLGLAASIGFVAATGQPR